MKNPASQTINVKARTETLEGVYTNNMLVQHTPGEFIMDFMLTIGSQGTLNARVIASPGHLKRIYNALGDNIHKYEQKFGKISEAQGPTGRIRFDPKAEA